MTVPYDPNKPLGGGNYPGQGDNAPTRSNSGEHGSMFEQGNSWYQGNDDWWYVNGKWRWKGWSDQDGELYTMTKSHQKLTEEEFKDRYKDRGLTDAQLAMEYDTYSMSYETKQINMQQADETALTDTYWQDMQNFMESMPGYDAYSQFIPEHLQRINEFEQGSMDPYTGQLTVGQDPYTSQMMNYLGNELFGGIDQTYDQLGGMFSNTRDAFLPAMDANYQEHVVNPMQEKLNAMGMSGSTPGMEMTAGAGQDYAIQRAQAGAQMDNTYANQMMGVEQARQGAWGQSGTMMGNLIGGEEARQRSNIGVQYQDWMAHQQDPFQRLGLGAQAMNTSAGALSSAAGQSIQAAEIPYAQGSAWDMMSAENEFMKPYYDAMSEPVSSGGGGCGSGGGC